MDTDLKVDLLEGATTKLLLKEETHCRKEIPYHQQRSIEVSYKGRRVGEYIPDLIALETVIMDTKVIERITEHETWANDELFANHKTSCRSDIKFQTREIGMGANRFMILPIRVNRVNPWLKKS